MTLRPLSLGLVVAQAVVVVYLAATGPWFARPAWIGVEITGLFLGAWALLYIDPSQLRILPEPARGARLVTRGPYRWVRHPLYTAVLLIALALVLDYPRTPRLVAWGLLLAVLVAKARYEESLLRRRFPEYAAYQRRTNAFLPLIY